MSTHRVGRPPLPPSQRRRILKTTISPESDAFLGRHVGANKEWPALGLAVDDALRLLAEFLEYRDREAEREKVEFFAARKK